MNTITTLEKRPVHMVDVVGQYNHYQDEIDRAIADVVRSGAYINGPAVKRFEKEMAEYLDVPHAIACASGTDALQIALMAIGVQPGDEIITTPFTFVATTETIALLGAKPVYVDIDPKTFNIDPEKIAERITPRTKAILPVHLFGQPCDITAIKKIADEHRLYLIEDAAQAVGATWQGKKTCGFGDIASISFYPSKNLGAFGDGGMMTTINDELAEKLRSIANHGASKTYFHDRLGVNSRLDSVQAAILNVKLKYLDQWNKRRREIAALYTQHFALEPGRIQTPFVHPNAEPIWHQYSIVVQGNRDQVAASLKAEGIPTNIYYPVPLHLQPAYRSFGGKKGDYPLTEFASDHIISIPMHSELSNDDAAYIAENVIHHIRNAAL